MPMPPSNSKIYKQFTMKTRLTSFECILKGERVEDSETFLCSSRKATLILVKPDEYDISLLIGIHYIFIQD